VRPSLRFSIVNAPHFGRQGRSIVRGNRARTRPLGGILGRELVSAQ
jgi:hypothetical protein